jgi:CheY-like chemotaxis protein
MSPLAGKRLLIVEGDRELAGALGAEAERLGARISLCGSGDEALAVLEVWPADGAVLDLPLAGGDVAELIEALRRNAIPSVAVSDAAGRGPEAAEEARRLGAHSVLRRPFRVADLLEAMGQALDEARPGEPVEPGAEGEAFDGAAFDSIVYSQARPALDEDVWRPLRRADPEGLARPLPDQAAARPARALPRPLLPGGDLAGAPLPRLLAVLCAGEATGALLLQRGTSKKLVLLEGGQVSFATSNLPAERFGPRCVREGIVDAAGMAAILVGLGPGETTASALMARGLLGAGQRARIVARQVEEIVCSAFAWREGSYRIALGPQQPRELVPLALFPGDLILAGVLRAAELPRLRRELPAESILARAPHPALDRGRLALAPAQAEMLACADGTKTVGDLAALSGLGEREALAFLQACRHMGVLDEADRALSSTRRIGFL